MKTFKSVMGFTHQELVYLLDAIDKALIASNKVSDCNRYCYLLHLQIKFIKAFNELEKKEHLYQKELGKNDNQSNKED